MKKIAIVAPFAYDNILKVADGNYYYKAKKIAQENSEFSFFLVDIFSLIRSGSVYCVDLLTDKIANVNIQCFELIHFFELERFLDREISIKQKWEKVYRMLDLLVPFNLNCINNISAIKYCSDKRYLLDLQAKKIPVIKTELINGNISLSELKRTYKLPSIIKPMRGECGNLVFRLDEVSEIDYKNLCNQDDCFLIQPFIPEVQKGEISLLFFGETLSHAFIRFNDFRGGKDIERYFPSEEEINFGHRVYQAFKEDLSIYRVDFFKSGSDFVLMEVESVDPYHYGNLNPDYYHNLGDFYKKYLSSRA